VPRRPATSLPYLTPLPIPHRAYPRLADDPPGRPR